MRFVYNLSRLFAVIVIVIIASKEGHRKCNFLYPPAIKGYHENISTTVLPTYIIQAGSPCFPGFPAVQIQGGKRENAVAHSV